MGGLAATLHEAARVGDGRGDLTHTLLRVAAGDLLQAPQRRPAHHGVRVPQWREEDGRLCQGAQGALLGKGVILCIWCYDSRLHIHQLFKY